MRLAPPYLEQVAGVVVVYENLELLELGNVLDDLHFGPGQPLPQLFVVRVRDVEELHSALFQVLDLRVIKLKRREGANC